MAQHFKVGDKVEVLDPGLLMMQKFAPPGAAPNNHGVIEEIWEEDNMAIINFPIGDDDPEEHSQSAPYNFDVIRLRNEAGNS